MVAGEVEKFWRVKEDRKCEYGCERPPIVFNYLLALSPHISQLPSFICGPGAKSASLWSSYISQNDAQCKRRSIFIKAIVSEFHTKKKNISSSINLLLLKIITCFLQLDDMARK